MESLCQLVLLSLFLWLYNKYVMCVHHNYFLQIKGIYIVSSFLNITINAALSICIHTSLKCGALLQIPISEDVKSKHTYILNFNRHCLTATQNSWYDAHSSEKRMNFQASLAVGDIFLLNVANLVGKNYNYNYPWISFQKFNRNQNGFIFWIFIYIICSLSYGILAFLLLVVILFSALIDSILSKYLTLGSHISQKIKLIHSVKPHPRQLNYHCFSENSFFFFFGNWATTGNKWKKLLTHILSSVPWMTMWKSWLQKLWKEIKIIQNKTLEPE